MLLLFHDRCARAFVTRILDKTREKPRQGKTKKEKEKEMGKGEARAFVRVDLRARRGKECKRGQED